MKGAFIVAARGLGQPDDQRVALAFEGSQEVRHLGDVGVDFGQAGGGGR